MDAHPELHAAWHSGRTARLIAGAGFAAAIAASVLFPVPARAITQQTEATLTETQKNVEKTAAELEAAESNLEDLEEQIEQNEAEIARIEAQLPAAQERAGRAMREIYKSKNSTNPLMGFVLNTQSLDNLISTMKYMDQVSDANIQALEDLNDLQAQLEVEKTELRSARAEAEAEREAAEEALEEAQRLREEAQKQAAAEAEREAMAQSSTSGAPLATPDNGVVDWDVDQATFVAEWAPRIDAYLAGSPLEGQGETFANAAWKYGVDPRWSPAISNTESSKGRHCFKPHNAWGWGQASWGSWEEAIDAHVAGLARGYGYTISVANAQKYCPPNWYNWYNDTLSEMGRI